MRSLGRPEVLRAAILAGLCSALVCWPRIATAPHLRFPVWYLEAVVFLGCIVLWGFVFAWHTQYTQCPVFTLKVGAWPLALATGAGLTTAFFWHFAIDPWLRVKVPADYPTTTEQWLAMTLFSLGLKQLFVVFAPLAWHIRLFGMRKTAFIFTVLFGLTVMVIREYRSPSSMLAEPFFLGLLAIRVAAQALLVYLRGGVLLVWWWDLLLQSRHFLQ
ncbi:MAG: hypothetical protein NT154_33165 [Verrucomicrobia bacterium]|nr:hypothetical protein [Verrucomicrobiota bacterium]